MRFAFQSWGSFGVSVAVLWSLFNEVTDLRLCGLLAVGCGGVPFRPFRFDTPTLKKRKKEKRSCFVDADSVVILSEGEIFTL